jgi:hypothetical protein
MTKVTRVKQSYPKYPEPQYVPYLERQLKALTKWVLFGILGLLWLAFLVACAATYAN